MNIIDPLEPEFNENGRIVDYVSGDLLDDRPEERVRQRLERLLHLQYDYPKNRIAREIPVFYGGSEAKDTEGRPVRADVGVFRTVEAARKKDQGQVQLIAETKRPKKEEGYSQLVSYIFNTSSEGAIWFNGDDLRVWRRVDHRLDDWPALPRIREQWDAVGRRRKSELLELKDPRGTLRRCHDRIHSRGATDDVAITMVRLLLSKWRDEERPGEYTEFYCTTEEFRTPEGRQAVAARVESLFAEVRDAHPSVFGPYENIGVSADEIIEVVTVLQSYRLLGETDEQWDVMGAAYEQYTADEMKKEGGEFFTNRLIVDLLTKMVVDMSEGTMLDPAGGTGGFCSAVLRRVRHLIREQIKNPTAQERAIANLKDRIFLIDKKPRLVKLAKAAMIVSGNGHRGFTPGDSLQPPDRLPDSFLEQCKPGAVSLVMTNPPWSGTIEGRISDRNILQNYQLAHRWEWDADGQYTPTTELASSGVPPEYLFVERCTNWLAPGGTLAIVLPKGVLDNLEPALAVRHFLFRHYQVQAVINCHKDTFQPYTGSRGCLIVAKKKKQPSDGRHYKIFMAINRKIGQDSEGVPVYKKDDKGKPTRELDHDLGVIYDNWQAFLKDRLKESEYTFSIDAKSLDAKTLKLNPQFFLPALNKSLQRIISLDGNGFSVKRLGDDDITSEIWKGSWWKREDLVVEAPNANTVEYLTPTNVKSGASVKYLDLSRCDARRREEILRHKAREGEILISRSGTIGRVTIVGRTLLGKILSDDLIRVWINDVGLRALVFTFLRSPGGQDQLLRNEYGTVQQHLEPPHVADVQLPLPDDKAKLNEILKTVKAALEAHERSVEMELQADAQILDLLHWEGDTTLPPEQIFRAYAETWRRQTRHLSSVAKMVSHPSYEAIIGMGKTAIPFLLAELRDRPDHWLVALNRITLEDPAKPQSTFPQAVDAWLAWGRKKRYLQ
jgi:type I restriction enzyme M protein